MTSWGCPREVDGQCSKVAYRPCDPGMKGCVLAGRFVFGSDEQKNRRLREKCAPPQGAAGSEPDQQT